MQVELLSIDKLLPYARNSRTHSDEQVAQIAASIKEFGFTNPILIDKDGIIIAGHGRVMGARKLNMDEVPCIRLSHLTENQKRAYVIADNKLALNAGWDDEMLAAEMAALNEMGYNLEFTGFIDDELDQLLALSTANANGLTDPDAVPDVEVKNQPITKLGDVWQMGNHRLINGDSTSFDVIEKLTLGKLVDCCWTDPPYNVVYETKAGKIENDNLGDKEFLKFLFDFYSAAWGAMKPGAAIYVAHADMEGLNFRSAFKSAGFKLSGCLVWRKNSLVLGRSDYQWIHEPILYGWKEGAAHKFYGGRKQTTVSDIGISNSPFIKMPDGRWQIKIGEERLIVSSDSKVEFVEDSIFNEMRPSRNDVHPTMKPVALIERMLKNSAKPGNLILDSFGGSGSTLMACERLGMSARLIELDAKYCDVIVKRWQDYTGKKATLESTGEAFPS